MCEGRGGGEQQIVGQRGDSEQDVLSDSDEEDRKDLPDGARHGLAEQRPSVVLLTGLEHAATVGVVCQTHTPEQRERGHERETGLDLVPDRGVLDAAKEGELGGLVGKVLVHGKVDRVDEGQEGPEAVDLGSVAGDLFHDPDVEADKAAEGHGRVEGVGIRVVGLVRCDAGERLGAAEVVDKGRVKGADGRKEMGGRVEGSVGPCSGSGARHDGFAT